MKFPVILIFPLLLVRSSSTGVYPVLWKCEPGSLNTFSVATLVAQAGINSECKLEAQKAFELNFKKFEFEADFSVQDETTKMIVENENTIRISFYNLLIDFLEHFGTFITNLEICFGKLSDKDSKHIMKIINDKCSDTIENLGFEDCKGTIFDELRNQFPKVRSFGFSSSQAGALQSTEMTIKLNELFPAVEDLCLVNLKDSDWEFFAKFPQMRLLRLGLSNEQIFDETRIIDFIEKNDISNIEISFISLKMLKRIAKCTPKLEKLALRLFADNFLNIIPMKGDLIRYDTLTQLVIESDKEGDKIHESVVFNELELLEILIQNDFNDNWMKFLDMQVNKELKDISIIAGKLDSEHLLAIAQTFQKVVFATFQSSSLYAAADLIQLFEQIESLQFLHVVCEIIEYELDFLYEKVPNNWKIYGEHMTNENRVNFVIERTSVNKTETDDLTVDMDNDIQENSSDKTGDDIDNYGNDNGDGDSNNAALINQSATTLIIILFIALILN